MDWKPVIDWLSEHGWRILIIIIVYIVLYFVMKRVVPIVVRKTVAGTMKKKPKSAIDKRTNTLSSVFIQTGAIVAGIIVVFTIISELGIDIGPALAGLGVAGIAIGFGAQSLVKDLFNGLLILLENQYGIGDVVKIAGIIGTVEDVGLRRTVLRDLDGIVHSIPNGEIGTASNYTKEWARINLNISVGYGEDLNRVIEVINRVCKEFAEDPNWAPNILKTPEVLRVDALGDSGIDIKILGDTKPMQQWAIMGELRLRLKRVFDEEGIEIPWPHTKVYFGDIPVKTGITELLEHKTVTPPTTLQTTKRRRRKKLPDVPDTDA